MNKKLIALILVLPMILMMTLFSSVNRVSLNVKVPVSKLEILGDEFVSLDLDKNERYFVDYVVYPTTASNKNVFFSVEQVGEQPKAQLEYKDGYIYPKSAGLAYACFSTADGGYRARFQVVVKATELKEISCSIENDSLIIGQSTQINTEFIPYSTTNKLLEYESSNTSILTVDDTGVVFATGKGKATIIVRSLANENVFDTIEVTVSAAETLSLAQTKIFTWKQTGTINLTIDTTEEFSLSYKVHDEYEREINGVLEPVDVQNAFIDMGDGNYKFEYSFINPNYSGVVVVYFTVITQARRISKACYVNKIQDLVVEFKSQDALWVPVGTTNFKWKDQITVIPSDAEVSYSVQYSNDNLVIGGLDHYANATKMGLTKATITIQSKERPSQLQVLEKDVYIYPDDLYINQAIKEYGIEKVLTIGKTDVYGNAVYNEVSLSYGGQEKGENFNKIEEKIVFETNSDKVVVENGKIKILDSNFNGIVDVNAKLDIANDVNAKLDIADQVTSGKFKIRCVGNGVEVDNFLDLHKATKNGKITILKADIINDFGIDEQGNKFYQGDRIDKIDSTYDTRFYGSSKPQVITLLQIKADLYGNGHIISANNVTKVDDSDRLSNKALFNGPLDFVAMGQLAKVKAQDNICFAVFENVTINNVELIGHHLEDVNGQQNLTDLDYAGTVVEVLGDNVNIEYSRINNGRTVLRAFGDINDATKTINVNVKNCVLSSAREFIVRIGSNALVDDTRSLSEVDLSNYDSPNIDPSEIFNFPVQQQYDKDKLSRYQDYEDKYIKTFMNIQNSILKDAGIFCVGIDSHFSGPMLFDALSVLPDNSAFSEALSGWKGLSSTSYGAKLTFNGDVRMYDWKEVANVDSSTLIEIGIDASQDLRDMLEFDIKKMINEVVEDPNYKSMVYVDKEGKQYVHGGIVFFGGGKNYGLFENNLQSFNDLSGYSILLSEVGKEMLEKAAGNKPFYFILYNANSNFTPPVQEGVLLGDSAYNCIFK